MPAVTVSTEEDPSPDETLTSTAALAITVSDGRLDLGRTALMTPERLVEPDAWVGHIPFAFWLVEAHRPRTLVELGTHSGNSYCAFCQAVAAFGTGTSCYAVDTWAGDPQAGFYGEEVYEELRRYHDPRYSAFSRLVRSTFDEAANHFADGSIDLLHIDGYHVYDAVRHDFDTWLPKLSDRGIVLFHDINVRERDFGAWRLWQEVTSDRPNFSFLHSHGLGVLGIGRDLPEAVVALLGAPAARAVPIRQWFAAAARSLQVELEASRLRETVRAHAATEATLAAERSRLAELEINRSTLESKLAEIEANRSALESGLLHATAERDDLRASATAASAEARRAQAESSNLVAERDVLRRELTRHQKACDHLTRELSKHRRRRQKMKRSLLRRSTRPLRAVIGALLNPLKQRKVIRCEADPRIAAKSSPTDLRSAEETPTAEPNLANSYAHWVSTYDTLVESDRISIRARLRELTLRPLISVVMPTYNSNPDHLRAAIASVRAQLYPHWELCIADDASTNPNVRETLREFGEDSRIKLVFREINGHISAASNDALALASGEFVALMDHDDLLPEHALYEVVVAINRKPDVDLIFSDEDQVDERGQRRNPYFKPAWDPELILAHNLVSHLGVYRRSILNDIGGFRHGFEGSQDYDLALRVALHTTDDKIFHIPRILYHWRLNANHLTFSSSMPERCADAAGRAISEYLTQRNEPAEVAPLPTEPLWHRARYELSGPPPLVTVIIPTRDRGELLAQCLNGVCNNTAYDRLQIIIVDNDSAEPATLRLLNSLAIDQRIRVLRFAGEFNFSAMNNLAAAEAAGDILLLLNNDIQVIDPSWLGEMVSHAARADVGAVGAKLLYPDGRVQHAGTILGAGAAEVAGHYGHLADRTNPGYYHLLSVCRTVSAVTAACLAVQRIRYLEVGGMNDQELKVAFNDVDFCLRLRERGYRNIYTPFAELYHHESASRGPDSDPRAIRRFDEECAYMKRRWSSLLKQDPYYNPNFTLASGHFELGWPPRIPKVS